MEDNVISVILPVHNTKKYIKQCMDSILAQTYDDIEILAIDSSTDETTDIIRKYFDNNKKIRHIVDLNGSYGYKLNLGISEARGEYLAIVDSDDYIMPDMFETLLQEIECNQLDFVKSDFESFCVDGGKEIIVEYKNNMWDSTYYEKILNFKENVELLNMISVSIWTGLYRTSFVKSNKITLHESPAASFQDTGFSVFTHIYANRVKYINKSFYKYRTDNSDSSVKSQKKYKVIADEWRWIETRLRQQGVSSDIMMQIALKKYSSYYWNYDRLSNVARIMFSCYVFEEIQEEYIAKNYRKHCPEFLRNQIRRYLLSRMQYEQIIKDFEKLDSILKKGNVVVASAGTLGKRIIEYDSINGFNGVSEICDAKEFEFYVEGKKFNTKKYGNIDVSDKDIILANKNNFNEIKKVLIANGADINRIYVFDSFMKYSNTYNYDVSIIVPVYNAGKYLSECIDSLVNQSMTSIEIMLVNDGSTDNSLAICNDYAKDYKNICVLSQENAGVTAARLHGVSEARGKYICFVDSDDFVDANYAENMYKEACLYDAEIVCGNLEHDIASSGQTFIEKSKVAAGLYNEERLKKELYPNMIFFPSADSFLFGVLQYLPAKLFRRDCILTALIDLNPEIFDGEDVLCLFSMLYKAKKVYVSECCDYHYRIHNESECHKKRDMRYMYNAFLLHEGLIKVFGNDCIMTRQVHYFMARYINNASLDVWGFKYASDSIYKGWRLPNGLSLENQKVAIYGAGRLGKKCYKDIIDINGLDVTAWFDSNAYGKRYGGMEILPMHRIPKTEFDYIIIAIADVSAFNEIRNKCISFGIPETKIIAPNEVKFHIETIEDYIR